MMKETCGNCKSSSPVDKATMDKSLKLQTSVAKLRIDPAAKPGRRAKIVALKALAEYEDIMKVKGLDSLSKKPTDPKDGTVYITCSNVEHLKDEKAEEGIVYKYYFSCPHFAAKP